MLDQVRCALRPTRSRTRRVDLPAQPSAAVCLVCRRSLGRYRCPSCGAAYCAATCFARHGCSERFFRGQCEREVREREAEGLPSGRVRCVRDLCAETRDEVSDAFEATRLKELADGADPTPEEERKALAAARRGEIRVTPWNPWWENTDGPPSIEIEIEIEEGGVLEAFYDHPEKENLVSRVRTLPAFRRIGKLSKPPSPLLINSALDVLYAYAFACRSFDGEHVLDAPEAAAKLVAASPVLSRDARHECPRDALSAVAQAARRTALLPATNAWYAAAQVDDAATLVAGRAVAAAALLDAWRLLDIGGAPSTRASKLRFLLLWVAHEAPDDAFPRASAAARCYRDALLADHHHHQHQQKKDESPPPPPPRFLLRDVVTTDLDALD